MRAARSALAFRSASVAAVSRPAPFRVQSRGVVSPVNGLMQEQPLLVSQLIDYAAKVQSQITSRNMRSVCSRRSRCARASRRRAAPRKMGCISYSWRHRASGRETRAGSGVRARARVELTAKCAGAGAWGARDRVADRGGPRGDPPQQLRRGAAPRDAARARARGAWRAGRRPRGDGCVERVPAHGAVLWRLGDGCGAAHHQPAHGARAAHLHRRARGGQGALRGPHLLFRHRNAPPSTHLPQCRAGPCLSLLRCRVPAEAWCPLLRPEPWSRWL